MERLFWMTDADERGALVAEPVSGLSGAKLRAVHRGDVRPRKPLRFRRAEGSRAADLVATTWIVPPLLSARFVEALEGFSGWRAHPARIDALDYHALAVAGRSGPIDESRSERITLPPPVEGGRAGPGLRGLFFEDGTWDGSDLFIPRESSFTFVTERVKEAIEDARLTNVAFEHLPEIERIAVA